MSLKENVKNFVRPPEKRFGKISYSQCGEDCIIEHMFGLRKMAKPSYIDIGAFHPYALSNTAKFHASGSKGINIEPNPDQFRHFVIHRKGDVNLNMGVGIENGTLSYYKMNNPTMNTFDRDSAAELVEKHGFTIIEEIKMPVKNIRDIIKDYAGNQFPDFLSLDVEGLDEQILSQIDYVNNYPKIICVETIEYTHDGTGRKNQRLIDFLLSKNYMIYADTYINSIFVNRKFWTNS
jgi:FkbM family methyltransferase